jgi:RHS repeat-associated protein
VRTSPLGPTQTTTYGEDGNGSLTQAANSATGTTTSAYDFERRLTKVGLPAGTTVQFAYDPDGLRARKTGTSGTVTDYVLDGLQALLEKNSAGATQVRYVPGLARIAGSTISYYLEDRLGSVAGLANASQGVTDTFRYDAWGNLLQGQGTTNPAYQWVGEAGYYLNPDAGLYLLGLRHYASAIGRFISRDPLNFDIVHKYCYSGNRPLYMIDPRGLLPGYGNYCGPRNGNGGTLAPIDDLDYACMIHDRCLATWYEWLTQWGYCDQELCKAANNVTFKCKCATQSCVVAATAIRAYACTTGTLLRPPFVEFFDPDFTFP